MGLLQLLQRCNTCVTLSTVKPTTSIRIDPESLHQARVAAVTVRKTLGRWLEEAIAEKINREKGEDDVTKTDR